MVGRLRVASQNSDFARLRWRTNCLLMVSMPWQAWLMAWVSGTGSWGCWLRRLGAARSGHILDHLRASSIVVGRIAPPIYCFLGLAHLLLYFGGYLRGNLLLADPPYVVSVTCAR